jgi:hypothetical protein
MRIAVARILIGATRIAIPSRALADRERARR